MRRLLTAVLAAALLLFTAGCESILFPIAPVTPTPKATAGGEKDGPAGTEKLENLKWEENISAQDGTTLVHYTVELPQFSPDEGALAQINSYYRREYSNFVSTAQEELRQIAEGNLREHDETGLEYTACEARQTYIQRRYDERYLSVSREISMSFGSTTVESYYKGDTFDLESGKALRLQDLFRVPSEEYLPRLRDEVIAQVGQSGAGGQYFENAAERVEAYLLEDNFWLEEQGLVLFFPEGTLGERLTSFAIDYLTVEDLLTEAVR